ncbi:hypothetical protein BCR44DRAFT_72803 [Catenaria anguillulae PL171]|uniref:S1 motif domain-containing protein n=1 Tax=Catenaria anguillulae PL171 TaxID=765915 RepID=A0A1Y2HZS4_9FUNG|nr:hypothetical protein BCR44DRAFT_72803 [Catenaria anguillulae PL171]
MSTTTRIVVPGERLGSTQQVKAGPGTYVRAGQVFSTIVGSVSESGERIGVQGKNGNSPVPAIGSIVTGRVKRINSRMAVVSVLLVESTPVNQEFEGVIRVDNVRATERDKVQIPSSFRPGDIVRAEVISLGEAHSYILSTARNDLGVIYAQSPAGATMIPISWEEMQCPMTGAIENRKVCQVGELTAEPAGDQ